MPITPTEFIEKPVFLIELDRFNPVSYILAAMIKACGGEVASHSRYYKYREDLITRYPRDPVVVIPELQKAFFSSINYEEFQNEREAYPILRALHALAPGLKIGSTRNYLVGGNVLYHPDGYILYSRRDFDMAYDLGNYKIVEQLQEFFGVPVFNIMDALEPGKHDRLLQSEGHTDLFVAILPNKTIVFPHLPGNPWLYAKEWLNDIIGHSPKFLYQQKGQNMNFVTVGNNVIMDEPGKWLRKNGAEVDVRNLFHKMGYNVRSFSSILPGPHSDRDFQDRFFAAMRELKPSVKLNTRPAFKAAAERCHHRLWVGDGGPRCLTSQITLGVIKERAKTKDYATAIAAERENSVIQI